MIREKNDFHNASPGFAFNVKSSWSESIDSVKAAAPIIAALSPHKDKGGMINSVSSNSSETAAFRACLSPLLVGISIVFLNTDIAEASVTKVERDDRKSLMHIIKGGKLKIEIMYSEGEKYKECRLTSILRST